MHRGPIISTIEHRTPDHVIKDKYTLVYWQTPLVCWPVLAPVTVLANGGVNRFPSTQHELYMSRTLYKLAQTRDCAAECLHLEEAWCPCLFPVSFAMPMYIAGAHGRSQVDKGKEKGAENGAKRSGSKERDGARKSDSKERAGSKERDRGEQDSRRSKDGAARTKPRDSSKVSWSLRKS